MRMAATLIGPRAGDLSDTHVDAARAALIRLGAAAISTDWLATAEAADVTFEGLDPDQADAAIRGTLGSRPVDCIVQPVEGRRKALLAADMESTIIEQEMLNEMATLRGRGAEVAQITARAMNGEIDFAAALAERVAALAGMPEAEIEEAASRITIMPGAVQLVRTMKAAGARTLLLTGGFSIFVDRVAASLGFDAASSNRLLFDAAMGERRLAGLAEPIVDAEAKRAWLTDEAVRMGIPLAATLAVGDGANDIPMLQAAGLGIAFRARPAIRTAFRARIDHADLRSLLYVQGYRAEEILG